MLRSMTPTFLATQAASFGACIQYPAEDLLVRAGAARRNSADDVADFLFGSNHIHQNDGRHRMRSYARCDLSQKGVTFELQPEARRGFPDWHRKTG
jgi:hypothetical protein